MWNKNQTKNLLLVLSFANIREKSHAKMEAVSSGGNVAGLKNGSNFDGSQN